VRLVADTGGIITAMDESEPRHRQFLQALNAAPEVCVTPLVVTETHFILNSAGERAAAAAFLDAVRDGLYRLVNPEPRDYGAAKELVARYEGQMERKRRRPGSLDLADAMNVVIAGRLDTNVVLATDQDYRRVVPLSTHAYFVLAPADSA
jgi:predicted nucleic acid-binding protein